MVLAMKVIHRNILQVLVFRTFDGEVILVECAAYLFGADIVVFMRAASPTAAEGRPHNLALVAARLG